MRNKIKSPYFIIALVLFSFATGRLAYGDVIDGEHGVLHVKGSLTASACRLDMASAWQTIYFGVISAGDLQHNGEGGRTVPVVLRLDDCLPDNLDLTDRHNGNKVWNKNMPSVKVSFTTLADSDIPSLIKIQGAGGFGLRLSDLQGKAVPLNVTAMPVMLSGGNNELKYLLTPVRTPVPLHPGSWQALINIGFSYD